LIYLDTSVVLAQLFAKDRSPAAAFWTNTFVSSRLLEFEVFNRVHARGAGSSHVAQARHFIDRVNLLELSAPVLGRALLPFAAPVRTLDALHLATMDFARAQGLALELATYDQRLAIAAATMGFALSAATR
jgi:predicted nucleic acid-binding protein